MEKNESPQTKLTKALKESYGQSVNPFDLLKTVKALMDWLKGHHSDDLDLYLSAIIEIIKAKQTTIQGVLAQVEQELPAPETTTNTTTTTSPSSASVRSPRSLAPSPMVADLVYLVHLVHLVHFVHLGRSLSCVLCATLKVLMI